MSDSLFNDAGTPTPASDKISASAELFATKLMEIRNERGEPKYDSIEKALDALNHSQTYIPQLKHEKETLEQEVARLREDLAKRQGIEEVISRLSPQPHTEAPNTQAAPVALDEAAVQQMLQRALTEQESKKLAEQNLSAVRSALVAKFGEKAADEVKTKAASLGLPMSEVDRIAATSPSAVLAWFNASSPASSSAPVRSTVSLPTGGEPAKVSRPEKSILRGASSKDQAEFMRRIREEVFREHGIDS